MLTGILGVWLSIKEKVWAWPFFIACYSCYVYISFSFKLPALMIMNTFFIALSFYGWIKWRRQTNSNETLYITRTSLRYWPIITALIALGTLSFGWLIAKYGSSDHIYIDAFATCCGFTAQWMLGRKYIETWIFWLISDLIYLIIFAMELSWPTVVLFGVFTLLAIRGWLKWKTSFQ